MEKVLGKKSTVVINEKTPLMILAGHMFLELFLNVLVNNVDTLMLSHYAGSFHSAVNPLTSQIS